MSETVTRIAVFGSCVSRDTIDPELGRRYVLTKYIARHSVLSIGSDASRNIAGDVSRLSPFQRRNFLRDVQGRAESELAEIVDEVDVLLWDLADERHGVVRFDDGSYMTRSIEALGDASLAQDLGRGQLLKFGQDDHFGNWAFAADRFVSFLRDAGLWEKTLVIAVPWAEVTEDGLPTPSSMGTTAYQANLDYARYYQHLRSVGGVLCSVENAAADAAHRWGPAPFHYSAQAYTRLRRDVDTFYRARLNVEIGDSATDS